MIEVKDNFSGGLDFDSGYEKVPRISYVDALNITRGSNEVNTDYNISNIVGNQLVNYALPSGANKVIGAEQSRVRNSIAYMVYNDGGYHSVLEYNRTTGVISKIFENLTDSNNIDILGFTENEKITAVNIYIREEGDLLFFLDSLRRPTVMNIEKMKSGYYTPVTRDIIDVGRIPPPSPPQAGFISDVNKRSNSFRNKLTRYKYRFVYDDFETSTYSPISKVVLPLNILNDTYTNVITNNNAVLLSMNTGPKNVKFLELCMSYVNKTNDWSDFMLIDKIDMAFKGVAGVYSVLALTTTYSFTFSGIPPVGTVITLNLLRLSDSVVVPMAVYTTVIGDTPFSVTKGLGISSAALGLTFGSESLGIIYLLFDSTLYSYDSMVIVPTSVLPEYVDLPYAFYNESTYPTINIDESILLYDFVPDEAESQELINGNVLGYGNVTEGYDKDLLPNVDVRVNTIATGSGSSGSLNGVSTDNGVYVFIRRRYDAAFTGVPAVGTTVTIKFTRLSDSVIVTAAQYVTVFGDIANNVVTGLIASLPTYNIANYVNRAASSFKYEYFLANYSYLSLEIVEPAFSGTANSISTFPFSNERNLALAYFDKKGKTNGVLYSTKVVFPAYAEDGSEKVLLPYITAKIYHTPPIWADNYQWLLTKDNTNFIYWYTIGVNTTEANYIYFDVTNFPLNAKKFPTTVNVLNYTFQDGDRMRLIKRDVDNVVFNDTYDAEIFGLVVDPTISGVSKIGTFLKIKKVAPLSGVDYTSKFFIIQIYRPAQQIASNDNQVFYEFGEQFKIGDAGLSTRYHFGQTGVQDITNDVPAEFNFYEGDVYFRPRSVTISDGGTTLSATFPVLDRNFVDNYISAVNSIDGRPNLIDTNARRATYKAMVRFGQAYQPNTNINGLNRFYPNNFEEADESFGGIKALSGRDRQLRVFQELKVGQMPLFSEIRKNANGGTVSVVTDKLLNPIGYYAGDYGIGTCPESLASFNFADYFCDNNRGVICRLSNDGVTPISIIYKANSFANSELPLRKGNYKIYGAYEPNKAGNYIIALEAVGASSAKTINFAEDSNSFETKLSYLPEMMVSLNELFITFKNGKLYTHDNTVYNNFYGVQYDSYVDMVFNVLPLAIKQPMSVEEIASKAWYCPAIDSPVISHGTTKQQSNLIEEDFGMYEGKFKSSLYRDINSVGGLINGEFMKGQWVKIRFLVSNTTNLVTLSIVSLDWNNSALNNK